MARTKKFPVKHTDERKKPLAHSSEKAAMTDNTKTKQCEPAAEAAGNHEADSNQVEVTDKKVSETDTVAVQETHETTVRKKRKISKKIVKSIVSPLSTYSCGQCYMAFSVADFWRKHMKRMHYEKYMELQKDGLITDVPLDGTRDLTQDTGANNATQDVVNQRDPSIRTDQEMSLSYLDERVTSNEDTQRGEKDVLKNKDSGSNLLSESEKPTEQADGETEKEEKPYKCDLCGAGFSHSGNIQRHKKVHVGENLHYCGICGVGFTSIHMKDGHEKSHSGEKPYKCSICAVGFTRKGYLNIHTRIHSGEKPYKCNVCGAGFTQCGHLQTHKRIHTGEKPFVCGICGAGFTQCGHLQTHKRLHTGEKPYVCDVCGAGFIQCGHLQTHKRKHTGLKPYKCDICGTEFTQCGHLQAHKKLHTEEVVGSLNGDNGDLIQDAKLFTKKFASENKPCKCEVCGKGFSHNSSLQRHKRLHKKIDPSPVSVDIADGGKVEPCDVLHADNNTEVCSPGGVESHERESRGAHRRLNIGQKSFMFSVYGDFGHSDGLSLEK